MTYDARRQASQQQDVPKEGCQDGFGEAQYTLWNALRRVTPSSGTNLCRTTSRKKSWTKWEKQRERWNNSDIERLFWSGGGTFLFSKHDVISKFSHFTQDLLHTLWAASPQSNLPAGHRWETSALLYGADTQDNEFYLIYTWNTARQSCEPNS